MIIQQPQYGGGEYRTRNTEYRIMKVDTFIWSIFRVRYSPI